MSEQEKRMNEKRVRELETRVTELESAVTYLAGLPIPGHDYHLPKWPPSQPALRKIHDRSEAQA